jgi:hypothetical protein
MAGSKVRLLPRNPKSSKARILIRFHGPQTLPDKDGTATTVKVTSRNRLPFAVERFPLEESGHGTVPVRVRSLTKPRAFRASCYLRSSA